ncbi:MAG: hypothetical protein LQ340_006002 [Diploschistes diacapsis]|nr:MAG: hypothetical protein LQ340_006002 [Diploschistes diacapsis]
MAKPEHYMSTSGERDAVWVHQEPYSNRPHFTKLDRSIETDVCIVGAGIAGISTAYELVSRGVEVTMIEAREVVSGESGRTSGHLNSALDDGYTQIEKKHGREGAKIAAESSGWAVKRVGEIAEMLGIDCEYRRLPGYEISQYPRGNAGWAEENAELKEEALLAKELGIEVEYREDLTIKGWDGKVDQRGGAVFINQATFHPTKYLVGILRWLKEQPNFRCYTYTRMMSITEKGIELAGMGRKTVEVSTIDGHTISANHAVEATVVPLQKLSVVAEMEYHRTYCIAIRVPKNYIEDCTIYDQADAYKYVRFTACDDKDDYLVIGGCDHKVGQEEPAGRFEELEQWVRERFTRAGTVDYAWSGQIYDPVDHVAFIGLNPQMKHTYIVTGDSGDGLTHGVLAGRLLTEEIQSGSSPWSKLYSPKRVTSIVKSASSMLSHDLQINAQYKRFLQSDIEDLGDLSRGSGGVLNPKTGKPIAIYKDDDGTVHKFSALCPHMKGVVCWNPLERSWDCPVHGSRFSKDGHCINGPAKMGLEPENEAGEEKQKSAI